MFAGDFDGELVLYWPTVVPPARSQGQRGVLYFASWDINGNSMPLCVSLAVAEGERHPGYPNGTRARVVGRIETRQQTAFLAASSISAVHLSDVAPGRLMSDLFWPALLAAGVVSTGKLATIQPRVGFHSLVVWDNHIRAGAPCRIQCLLPDNQNDGQVIITGTVSDVTPVSVSVSVREVLYSTELSMICDDMEKLGLQTRPQTAWTPPPGNVDILPAVRALALNDDGSLPRLARPEIIIRPSAPATYIGAQSSAHGQSNVPLVKDRVEMKYQITLPAPDQDLPPGQRRIAIRRVLSFEDVFHPGFVKFDP